MFRHGEMLLLPHARRNIRHRNRTRHGNSSFPFHYVFRIRSCIFSIRAHISSWSRTRDTTSIRSLNHGWNRTIVTTTTTTPAPCHCDVELTVEPLQQRVQQHKCCQVVQSLCTRGSKSLYKWCQVVESLNPNPIPTSPSPLNFTAVHPAVDLTIPFPVNPTAKVSKQYTVQSKTLIALLIPYHAVASLNTVKSKSTSNLNDDSTSVFVSGPVVRPTDETRARCFTNGYLRIQHDHRRCNGIEMISSWSLNKSSLFRYFILHVVWLD